jgi:hypothetical protein
MQNVISSCFTLILARRKKKKNTLFYFSVASLWYSNFSVRKEGGDMRIKMEMEINLGQLREKVFLSFFLVCLHQEENFSSSYTLVYAFLL